ncbi:MAG: hypothetical protein WDO14_11010 [Bacteroidota bacterium]
MKNLGLFLMLGVFILSCKDSSEDAAPAHLFTITTSDLHDLDAWIVLRDDASGELIEARQLSDNKEEIFDSPKQISTLAVTLFYPNLHVLPITKLKNVDVYRGVKAGSEWTAPEIPFGSSGFFNFTYGITINNLPDKNAITFSSTSGELYSKYAEESKSSFKGGVVGRVGETRHLVVVSTPTQDPKYLWLENLVDGESRTVSYNDFKSFDKVINISFPAGDAYSNVAATDNIKIPYGFATSYVNPFHDDAVFNSGISEFRIGYLNEFASYRTLFITGPFRHVSLGAPAAINYVGTSGYSATAGSNLVKDYTVTATSDFVYSGTLFASYTVDLYTEFRYFGPKGVTTFYDPLTPEILEKYSIDMSKLSYQYTDFMVKGRSYDDFVESVFDPEHTSTKAFEENFVRVE